MLHASDKGRSNGPSYENKLATKQHHSKIMAEKIAFSLLYR